MAYEKIRRGRRYCSMKCRSNDPNVREKTKQTCIEKFGVDNPAKSQDVYKKIEETNLKKYGVKHHLSSPEIIAKREATCLERYGKTNTGMCNIFQEKRKQTMLDRYGVQYTGQSQELMQKVIETNTKRYGGVAPSCSNIVQQKMQKTCLDKFGFENIKYFELWNTILSWSNYVVPMFTKNEFKGKQDENGNYFIYKWQCVKCGRIFESRIYCTKHLMKFGKNYMQCPRCEHCFPYTNSGTSQVETELINFCKLYQPNLIIHNFELIAPYELDIVIPDIKLAIEFNGNYFHSIEKKEPGYHLMKSELCRKIGYRLIHIWENEWVEKDNENLRIKLAAALMSMDFKFIGNELHLDRSWYPTTTFVPRLNLVKIIPPRLIQRREFLVEDCGQFVFKSNDLLTEEDKNEMKKIKNLL